MFVLLQATNISGEVGGVVHLPRGLHFVRGTAAEDASSSFSVFGRREMFSTVDSTTSE